MVSVENFYEGLTEGESRVLNALLYFSSWSKGETWAAQETIALLANVSDRTVRRAIRKFEKEGRGSYKKRGLKKTGIFRFSKSIWGGLRELKNWAKKALDPIWKKIKKEREEISRPDTSTDVRSVNNKPKAKEENSFANTATSEKALSAAVPQTPSTPLPPAPPSLSAKLPLFGYSEQEINSLKKSLNPEELNHAIKVAFHRFGNDFKSNLNNPVGWLISAGKKHYELGTSFQEKQLQKSACVPNDLKEVFSKKIKNLETALTQRGRLSQPIQDEEIARLLDTCSPETIQCGIAFVVSEYLERDKKVESNLLGLIQKAGSGNWKTKEQSKKERTNEKTVEILTERQTETKEYFDIESGGIRFKGGTFFGYGELSPLEFAENIIRRLSKLGAKISFSLKSLLPSAIHKKSVEQRERKKQEQAFALEAQKKQKEKELLEKAALENLEKNTLQLPELIASHKAECYELEINRNGMLRSRLTKSIMAPFLSAFASPEQLKKELPNFLCKVKNLTFNE